MQYILTQEELDIHKNAAEAAIKRGLLERKEELKEALKNFSVTCARAVRKAQSDPMFNGDEVCKKALEELFIKFDLIKLWE